MSPRSSIQGSDFLTLRVTVRCRRRSAVAGSLPLTSEDIASRMAERRGYDSTQLEGNGSASVAATARESIVCFVDCGSFFSPRKRSPKAWRAETSRTAFSLDGSCTRQCRFALTSRSGIPQFRLHSGRLAFLPPPASKSRKPLMQRSASTYFWCMRCPSICRFAQNRLRRTHLSYSSSSPYRADHWRSHSSGATSSHARTRNVSSGRTILSVRGTSTFFSSPFQSAGSKSQCEFVSSSHRSTRLGCCRLRSLSGASHVPNQIEMAHGLSHEPCVQRTERGILGHCDSLDQRQDELRITIVFGQVRDGVEKVHKISFALRIRNRFGNQPREQLAPGTACSGDSPQG